MSDDDDSDFGLMFLFELPGSWIGLFLLILIVGWMYWAHTSVIEEKCQTYGRETGREVKVESRECYVRTGDHFVPRSEYGRQP